MEDPTNDITINQWRTAQRQEFTEIKLSKCCHSEILAYWIPLKSICMGCWSLNPEKGFTLYACSLCGTECETEECNCYMK